jgi:hypothetical protein
MACPVGFKVVSSWAILWLKGLVRKTSAAARARVMSVNVHGRASLVLLFNLSSFFFSFFSPFQFNVEATFGTSSLFKAGRSINQFEEERLLD